MYTERCDSLCFSSQPAYLVADFLVCGFALFLVLVFAFNLCMVQSFKPDYTTLKRLAPHLVLGLALGLDHLLAHLPRVRDTGLHIVIPGTHSSP